MTVQHPPDWYPDPFGRFQFRYWDGRSWTQHASTNGQVTVDAPVASPSPPLATSPTPMRPRTNIGDPSTAVSPRDGRPTLYSERVLVVHQEARRIRRSLGYAVSSQSGEFLGAIEEVPRDVTARVADHLRHRTQQDRTFEFLCTDAEGATVLSMTRPETRGKSVLIVENAYGAPVGQIVQESYGIAGGAATLAHAGLTSASALTARTIGGVTGAVVGGALSLSGASTHVRSKAKGLGLDKMGHTRFGLYHGGDRIGGLYAHDTKAWDFTIRDADEAVVGRVTKTWAGWAKERFTTADNYVVELDTDLQEPLHSLVIAAALALDIALNEGDAKKDMREGKRLKKHR